MTQNFEGIPKPQEATQPDFTGIPSVKAREPISESITPKFTYPRRPEDMVEPSVGLVLKEGTRAVARQFLTFSSAMEKNRAVVAEQRGVGIGVRKPTLRETRLGIEPSLPMFSTEEKKQEYISGALQRSTDLMKFADIKLKPANIRNVGGFKQYGYDFVRMVPQIAAQVGLTVATGGIGGMVFMGVQIGGASYDELVKQGTSHDFAFKAMFMNAAMQAPLEAIGLAKALKFWKPGKIAKKWIRGFAVGAGGEFLTEWAQKYPELVTHQWAIGKTAGLSDQEILDSIVENLGKATKEGIYEGLVAAPFGGIFGGLGGATTNYQKDFETTKEAEVTPPPSISGQGTDPHLGKMYQQSMVEAKNPDGTYRVALPDGRRINIKKEKLDTLSKIKIEETKVVTDRKGLIGTKATGAAFKSKAAAAGTRTRIGLKETHDVVQVSDGYMLRPKKVQETPKEVPKQTLYDEKVAPAGNVVHKTYREAEDAMAERYDTAIIGESEQVIVPNNADPDSGFIIIPRSKLNKSKTFIERRDEYGENYGGPLTKWVDRLESLMNLRDQNGKRKWRFGWLLDVAEKLEYDIRFVVINGDKHSANFGPQGSEGTLANARGIFHEDGTMSTLITFNGSRLFEQPNWRIQGTAAHEIIHSLLRHKLKRLDSAVSKAFHTDLKKIWTNISDKDKTKLVNNVIKLTKRGDERNLDVPTSVPLASLINRLEKAAIVQTTQGKARELPQFEELVTYALSDPRVARALNKVKVTSPKTGAVRTLWNLIAKKVAQTIGKGKSQTVLGEIVEVLNQHAGIGVVKDARLRTGPGQLTKKDSKIPDISDAELEKMAEQVGSRAEFEPDFTGIPGEPVQSADVMKINSLDKLIKRAQQFKDITYRARRTVRSTIKNQIKQIRGDYQWLKRAIKQYPKDKRVVKEYRRYNRAMNRLSSIQAILTPIENIKTGIKILPKDKKLVVKHRDLGEMKPETLIAEIQRLASQVKIKEATRDEKMRLEIAKRIAIDSFEVAAFRRADLEYIKGKAVGAEKARAKKKTKGAIKALEILKKDIEIMQKLRAEGKEIDPRMATETLNRAAEAFDAGEIDMDMVQTVSELVTGISEDLRDSVSDEQIPLIAEVGYSFPHKLGDKFVTRLLNRAVPGQKIRYDGYYPKGFSPSGYSFTPMAPDSPLFGNSMMVPDLKQETIKRVIDERIKMFTVADETLEVDSFSTPEAEKAAKKYRLGITGAGIAEKWQNFKENIVKLSREWESISFKNRKLTAVLTFALRRLRKMKTLANSKAIQHLKDVLRGLSPDQYLDLERLSYLMDFNESLDIAEHTDEVKKGGPVVYKELPEGFTPAQVRKDAAIWYNKMLSDPELKEAWEARLDVWDKIRDEYIIAMGKVGYDARTKMQRAFYFRHQVLDYMQAQRLRSPEGEAKLALPTGRSHLRTRKGSKLPINLNYVQAEHEVMTQLIYDIEVAKVMQIVREQFDISSEVRAKAKEVEEDVWKKLIPEDYVVWQPTKGHIMYLVDTIPAKLAEQVLTGQLKQAKITAKHLGKVLAIGRPYRELVIPRVVKNMLENDVFNAFQKTNAIGKVFAKAQLYWKQWQIISPFRALKYNFRNLTGDAEAVFVGNPKAFLKLKKALQGRYRKSQEWLDWLAFGGMESTFQAQEMEALLKDPGFRKLQGKGFKLGDKPIKKMIELLQKPGRELSDYRESILRFAAYLDYLNRINEDGSWKQGKTNYGASMREEVDGLVDRKSKAFMLSNDLLGAYDRVSERGQWLRKYVAPFWSFQEINFTRTFHFYRNAVKDDRITGVIGRKMGVKVGWAAIKLGKLTLQYLAFTSAIIVYNNMMWGDAEDSLPDEMRRRSHIIYWHIKGKTPSIVYFPRIGVLADLLEWTGADTVPADLYDLIMGNRTFSDIAKDYTRAIGSSGWGGVAPIRAFANKVTQMLGPQYKIPMELVSGQTLFPDMWDPKPILENDLVNKWIPGSVIHQIKTLTGSKTYWDELDRNPRKIQAALDLGIKTIMYKQDQKRMAYFATLENIDKIRKLNGRETSGYFKTERGMALRDIAVAWRYGDANAYANAIERYVDADPLNVDMKNIDKQFDRLHPLDGLDTITHAKYFELVKRDERVLKQFTLAMEYYAELRAGIRFGEGKEVVFNGKK